MRRQRTDLEKHFEFGANWTDFSQHVDARRVEDSVVNLRRLLGRESFDGERWIDVGCGSGLSSVAAATLGANVLAIDLDPKCVETTELLALRFGVEDRVTTQLRSVFDLSSLGREFDVVYSWGVLHHTGDMDRAIKSCLELVRPGGEFAVALYRKTRLCWFWKIEKRLYKSAGKRTQSAIRSLYLLLFRLAFKLKGQDFGKYRDSYSSSRGMKFEHDVHDWLGGYPYESISPRALRQLVGKSGFAGVREFVASEKVKVGILGSGCDEFVFRKNA